MMKPSQSIQVYSSSSLRVTNGANLGDPLSFAAELVFDDIYTLMPGASRHRMSLEAGRDGTFVLADDTQVGTPGHAVALDACLTFMAADGQTNECLVLVEVDAEGGVVEVYALPMAPMAEKGEVTLVGIDQDSASRKLAQVACVSFTRGTLITLHTGAQKPIETLAVGDRILTRDDGPQVIRWIGMSTVRAVGEMAPVLIRSGTLHNSNDLIVSPDHRLFIYQREDHLGAGRAKVMVKAKHLVNGDTVTRQSGGFVDYFQLLFDHHQIIYAEGIAAESLMIDTRTRPALPDGVEQNVGAERDRHTDPSLTEYEVTETLLDRPDVAALLRRSSTG